MKTHKNILFLLLSMQGHRKKKLLSMWGHTKNSLIYTLGGIKFQLTLLKNGVIYDTFYIEILLYINE